MENQNNLATKQVNKQNSITFKTKDNDDSEEVTVEFVWNEGGEEVMIAGNFLNKWETKLKMTKVDGVFRISLVYS